MRTLLHLSVLAVVLATGCATDSDAPHLFVGMSRDRLRARIGEPLRIERTPAGGEDWYYSFSGLSEVQAGGDRDAPSSAGSMAVTVSLGTGTEERPVHLSAEGCVIEPLPKGYIVR